MSTTIFAAIDVGSSELSMKIFEVSKKTGLKELEHIRHQIELGADTYKYGKIRYPLVQELCEVLRGFAAKMKEYDIHDYQAYATSAIREASNNILILDQIKLTSGIKVKILSNSEQRFLSYMAITLNEPKFPSIIEKDTALIDVGSGSTQISLFHKGYLYHTQNISIGTLRIRELLGSLEHKTDNYQNLITEYISNELITYYELFLPSTKIESAIAIGCNPREIILTKLLNEIKPKNTYFIPVTLCDGIAVELAGRKHKILPTRNFSDDIIYCARNIAKRFHCNMAHINNVEFLSIQIFDGIRKLHGLGKRERLILQLAVILHTCGDFINMNTSRENAYQIVSSSELIGLSDLEKDMVAHIVRYTTDTFPKYTQLVNGFSKDTYLTISKLFAIFIIANALDKSHRQKLSNLKVAVKQNTLTICVNTLEDITLECGLFEKKAEFFEEVYGIKPCIRQKRS